MPTPAEVDDFQQAIDDVKTLMVASLVEQWLETIQASPAESIDELRQFVVDIVSEYGQAAAATAIDFYDSVRPPGAPAFSPTPFVRDDLVTPGTLNWSTQPLLTDDWQQTLDRVAAEIQKAMMQAVVETLGEATQDDPLDVKFARFPQNPDPCAWCVLRASRGAIYWSEASAESGDHLKCGCKATPVFPGESLPYLRKPYMAQYLAGAAEADGDIAAAEPGKAKRKALLSGMRRANGIR